MRAGETDCGSLLKTKIPAVTPTNTFRSTDVRFQPPEPLFSSAVRTPWLSTWTLRELGKKFPKIARVSNRPQRFSR